MFDFCVKHTTRHQRVPRTARWACVCGPGRRCVGSGCGGVERGRLDVEGVTVYRLRLRRGSGAGPIEQRLEGVEKGTRADRADRRALPGLQLSGLQLTGLELTDLDTDDLVPGHRLGQGTQ